MDAWRIIEFPAVDEDPVGRWIAMSSKPLLTLRGLVFEIQTADAPLERFTRSPNERGVTAALHLVGYAGEAGSEAIQKHWDRLWSGTARFEVLKDHDVAATAARRLAEEEAIRTALVEAERELSPPAAVVG